MCKSKAQIEAAEKARERVQELHDAGFDLHGIAREMGISTRSVSNYMKFLGIERPKPEKLLKAANDAAPTRISAALSSLGRLSAADRAELELRRRSLIRAMSAGPTDDQRAELTSIVHRLDADDCARAALRSVAA